ncbi:MAG: U32 family peptidase [Oscillospiraceae bacterium]|nr:U32 family peptidase [Oscillospiraceae bacterium]
MLELLCPAGSFEALRAAVCNGADAVYLGVEGFNARRSARNFTLQELSEAVRYCHVRGVKVHLTLNTLVGDRELPGAAEVVATAAKAGVDAFIVQDLGMVDLCKQIAPNVALHASTQMSIHSLEGVKEAAAMGISRVVLARELSADDIANICRFSPVEIEVFVHGALCMCYSGQCYMSSVIGRRSGNRGQCAQPCRLPYGYDRFENKYPLSLKDNCLVEHLDKLRRAGVTSLKIEGRMKRPEYVATVTKIYREALNEGKIGESEKQALRTAFSRQGFTQGYFVEKTGMEMFGTHSPERDARLQQQSARASYENVEPQRVPVKFYAIVRRDEPVQLAVEDNEGHICKAQGAVPMVAEHRPLQQIELEVRLGKTGGTPYVCTEVRCILDHDIVVSAAEINRLRREVLVQLSALRGRVEKPELGKYAPPRHFAGSGAYPKLTVSVLKTEQITRQLRQLRPDLLYVPIGEILRNVEFYRNLRKNQPIGAILPRVIRGFGEQTEIVSQLQKLSEVGVERVLVGNLGQISLVAEKGFEVAGDFGLNLFNSRAMAVAKSLGLASATASFEMTLPQIRDLSKPLPVELIAYGRLPLMLTENCLMRNRAGVCSCQHGKTKLIDRKGEEFRVVRDGDTCRSVILNGKKLYLLDRTTELSRLGLWALRLSFTTENPGEVDAVLSDWNGQARFDPGSYTRGLYLRGVE